MRNKFLTKIAPYREILIGLVVFTLMTFTLAEIADRIEHGLVPTLDVQLSNWLHRHTSPVTIAVMLVLTGLGSTWFVIVIATGFIVFLMRRRSHGWSGIVACSVFGGMLLNRSLKFAFLRARPSFDDPILELTTYSFPSGHTMAATVMYGVLAAYLLTKTKDWKKRVLVIGAAAFLIALVAFSRVFLGVHYLSDVLGAIAEGLAWLSLCLTVAHSLRRQKK